MTQAHTQPAHTRTPGNMVPYPEVDGGHPAFVVVLPVRAEHLVAVALHAVESRVTHESRG